MPKRGDVVVSLLLTAFIGAILVAAAPTIDLDWTGAGSTSGPARCHPLYPPAWPVRAGAGNTVAVIVLGAHLAFGAAGMYLLMKRLDAGAFGGLVAALTWSLTGFPLSFAGRPWVLFPLCWLPWAIIFSDFYKLQPQWKTGTALLGLLAIPFYAGDWRTAALVPVAALLYLGGFIWPGATGLMGAILRVHLRKYLPLAGPAYLAAIAPTVIPAILSGTADPNEPQVLAGGGWVELLLPGLSSVERDTLPIAAGNGTISLSLWHVPLLYAALGAFLWRSPMRGPVTVLAVVCTGAGLVCGMFGVGWWAVAGLGLLGWSILAGGGADHVFTTDPERVRRLIAPTVAALVLAGVAAAVAAGRWSSRFVPLGGLSTVDGAAAIEDLVHAAAAWGATGLAFAAFAWSLAKRSLVGGLLTLILTLGSLGHDVFSHARSLLVALRGG